MRPSAATPAALTIAAFVVLVAMLAGNMPPWLLIPGVLIFLFMLGWFVVVRIRRG